MRYTQAGLFLGIWNRGGGYRKMLQGCKHARSINLHKKNIKKQWGMSSLNWWGGLYPPPRWGYKNITVYRWDLDSLSSNSPHDSQRTVVRKHNSSYYIWQSTPHIYTSPADELYTFTSWLPPLGQLTHLSRLKLYYSTGRAKLHNATRLQFIAQFLIIISK